MYAPYLLAAALLLAPRAAAGQLRFEAPAGNASIEIGAVVQPRYEHTSREGEEDLSSFFMRRVRIDLRGHVLTPKLTYRILPELARTASLRDGWVNYEHSPQLQLRVGQLSIPFQWHRHVSPSHQHFAERGIPSEAFGFPDGRDIGLLLHGQNPSRTLGWAMGLFDGAGRNVEHSNSSGNMASARLTLAALGGLPREEADLLRSLTPGLSFGLGLQGATRNEVRPWDLGRSPEGNRRADWITATVDASFRWQGLSLAAEVYLRRVDPDDPQVSNYHGDAFLLSAGYTLLPGRLELVGRYSKLRWDRDQANTEEEEWGAGLNLSHRGHDSKVRLQYLAHQRHRAGTPTTTATILVDYSLRF